MNITKRSPFTGTERTLDLPITQEEWDAWKNAGDNDPKRFVQNAFPQLSDDEREFIMTGITGDEWVIMTGITGDEWGNDVTNVPVDSHEGEPQDVDAQVPVDSHTVYSDDENEEWLGKHD